MELKYDILEQALDNLTYNELIIIYNNVKSKDIPDIYLNDNEGLSNFYNENSLWDLARSVYKGNWEPGHKYITLSYQTGMLESADDPRDIMDFDLKTLSNKLMKLSEEDFNNSTDSTSLMDEYNHIIEMIEEFPF